jgi:hypothetical protein
MRVLTCSMTIALAACLVVPAPAAARDQAAAAQDQGDVWRTFAGRVEAGTELTVRLHDGQRFRAALVEARDDVVMLQPRTRVPVPVQPVPYEAILSLERRTGGIGAGKAAAIGVATGAGTFLAILLILLANVD